MKPGLVIHPSLLLALLAPGPGCDVCWPRGGRIGVCLDDDTGDDDTEIGRAHV